MTSQKTFLNVDEASEYLGISKSHLYKHTHEKRIKFYKPNGKKLYFKLEDLESFILSGEVKTAEEIDREATRILIQEA